MTQPTPNSRPSAPADALPLRVEDLLARDEAISDEEADAEIDLPGAKPGVAQVKPAPLIAKTAPAPPAAPPPAPAEGAAETTPSVRVAIDRAADILRELRGNQ